LFAKKSEMNLILVLDLLLIIVLLLVREERIVIGEVRIVPKR
jgi:hypothetical protein